MINEILKSSPLKNVLISSKIKAPAKKTEILWIMSDGTIKVWVKADKENGKANQKLLDFLKKIVNIPLVSIDIVS